MPILAFSIILTYFLAIVKKKSDKYFILIFKKDWHIMITYPMHQSTVWYLDHFLPKRKKGMISLKKIIVLFLVLASLFLLSSCGFNELPGSTTRPLPDITVMPDNPNTTDDPDASDEPVIDPANDERNQPEMIRGEIANMLRDAEELISEGLYDDAKMVLRDLRSRNLTSAEKKKVDALQSRMITISN